MNIKTAVRAIVYLPDSWVKVEHVHRIVGGIELEFAVHKGKRGKRIESWKILCNGVREINLSELDGGGLAVYPSTHPAARQYTAAQAELRWPRTFDRTQTFAALYMAHMKATDDWIPFDCYLQVNTPSSATSHLQEFAPISGNNFVCRGPDFLLRAYAKALRAIGEKTRLTVRKKSPKSKNPKVLHFGTSYVVADSFEPQKIKHLREESYS